MDISGPLKFKVIQEPDKASYQLLVDFTPEFRGLALIEQGSRMRQYVRQLEDEIDKRDEDDRDRAGMMMAYQISENLLPYVERGELELEQTIVIQVGEDSPAVALTDLLGN